MSGPALALRQIRFENKAFWRNPAAAFFTFAFPLIFLFIFPVLFGSGEVTVDGRTIEAETYYVPGILAFAAITACFTNIAISITFARDEGILKRVRGTPLPPWAYLMGRMGHAVLVQLLLVVIVSVVGVVFYGVSLPTDTLPAFLVTLVVGAATFCSLGLAATAIIPNADAAPAIVNAIILPLLFISGVFFPLTNAPEWVVRVADLFPVKQFVDAILVSFLDLESGSGWRWTDLAIVAAWGIAGLLLAARFFTWEPRR